MNLLTFIGSSRRAARRFAPAIEALESRIAPAVVASLANGLLSISIGAFGDHATLFGDGSGDVLVAIDSNPAHDLTFLQSSVLDIQVTETAAGGVLTLDYSAADPLASAGFSFRGGGFASEQLQINGSTGENVTWLPSGTTSNTGTLLIQNGHASGLGLISYANLGPSSLVSVSAVNSLSAQISEAEAYTLSLAPIPEPNDFSFASLSTTGAGGSGPQSLAFSSSVGKVTLSLGQNELPSASSSLTVTPLNLALNLTVNGGPGNDTLSLNYANGDPLTGNGSINFHGGGGNDSIVIMGKINANGTPPNLPAGTERITWAPSATASYAGSLIVGYGESSTTTVNYDNSSGTLIPTVNAAGSLTLNTEAAANYTLGSGILSSNAGSAATQQIVFTNVPALNVNLGLGEAATDSSSLTVSASIYSPLAVTTGAGSDFLIIPNALTALECSWVGGAGTNTIVATLAPGHGYARLEDGSFIYTDSAGSINQITFPNADVNAANLAGGDAGNTFDLFGWSGSATITGGTGSDALVIEPTFGGGGGHIVFHGGGGLDSLSIVGESSKSSAGGGVTWIPSATASDTGTIIIGSGSSSTTITYDDANGILEPAISSASAFTLMAVAAANYTLAPSTSSTTLKTSAGSAVTEELTFADTPALNVSLGTGEAATDSSSLAVDGFYGASSLQKVAVTTGAGNDFLILTSGIPSFSGGFAWVGGAGTNTIVSTVPIGGSADLTNAGLNYSAGFGVSGSITFPNADVNAAVLTDGGVGGTFNLSAWTGMATINGGHGVETLELDYQKIGDPSSALGPITFNGGAGSNEITFTGAGSELVTWAPSSTASSTGSLDIAFPSSKLTINYDDPSGTMTPSISDVASLQVNATSAGNYTLGAVSDGASLATNIGSLAVEKLTFHGVPEVNITLGANEAPTDSSSLTVSSLTGESALQTLSITTGRGHNTLILSSNLASLSLPVGGGAFTWNGGGGVDTIEATLLSAGASMALGDRSLVYSTGGALTLSELGNERSAILSAGAGGNAFTLSQWTGAATVNGGAGNDTLLISYAGGADPGVNVGPIDFHGGGGSDTILFVGSGSEAVTWLPNAALASAGALAIASPDNIGGAVASIVNYDNASGSLTPSVESAASLTLQTTEAEAYTLSDLGSGTSQLATLGLGAVVPQALTFTAVSNVTVNIASSGAAPGSQLTVGPLSAAPAITMDGGALILDFALSNGGDPTVSLPSIVLSGAGGYAAELAFIGAGNEAVSWAPSALISNTGALSISYGPGASLAATVSYDQLSTGLSIASAARLSLNTTEAEAYTLDATGSGCATLATSHSGNGLALPGQAAVFTNVPTLNVSLGAGEAATDSSSFTIHSLSGEAALKNLSVATGAGDDSLTITPGVTSLNLPTSGGAFTWTDPAGQNTLTASADISMRLTDGSLGYYDNTEGYVPDPVHGALLPAAAGQLLLNLAASALTANLTGGVSNNVFDARTYTGTLNVYGGSSGNPALWGSDTFVGGLGVNALYGGEGSNWYVLNGANGVTTHNTVVDSGSSSGGTNFIDYSLAQYSATVNAPKLRGVYYNGVTVDLGWANDGTAHIVNSSTSSTLELTGDFNELRGTAQNDILIGGASTDLIIGGGYTETATGVYTLSTKDHDIIAGGGADQSEALYGNANTLFGGFNGFSLSAYLLSKNPAFATLQSIFGKVQLVEKNAHPIRAHEIVARLPPELDPAGDLALPLASLDDSPFDAFGWAG